MTYFSETCQELRDVYKHYLLVKQKRYNELCKDLNLSSIEDHKILMEILEREENGQDWTYP